VLKTNPEKKSQVFNDYVSVIIGLEEPVSIIAVMIVDICECGACFTPQIVMTFRDIESHSWQLSVMFGAHKQQHIAA